jgi:hypothetical protein
LEASPARLAQKEAIEDTLNYLLPLLKAEKQSIIAVNKKQIDVMNLDWQNVDKWETTQSPFIIYFWANFLEKNFDTAKITTKAHFSFGAQQVEAVLSIIHNGESNGYQCFSYKCEAAWPEAFLSASVDLTIDVGYDNNSEQKSLTKTFIIEGISAEGQSIIDFLTALDIDTQLSSDAWDYLNNQALKIDVLKTLDQLIPVQYKLNQIVKKVSKLQELYQGLAYKTLFFRLIKNDPTVLYELFKGHQKVVLKTDGPIEKSLQYLRDWSFPKNFEKEFLLPLSLKLEAVNKKIEAIHEKQALAEQNYIQARTDLELKNPIAANLLTHVYAITNIDKAFQTLRINYPEIIPPDGTDAFRLVLKEKDFIESILAELNNISTQYKEVSAAFLVTYKELYKGNGVLKDKILNTEATNFKKAAKKAKQDIPANLELRVFGKLKGVKLHTFLFDSIDALLKQADAFCDTFYKDFKRIRKDFLVIDTSTSENSIRAYNPVDDITGNFMDESNGDSIIVTYQHEKLPDTQLTDDQGINSEDVDQGALADCYFLSSVASLAQFAPETIYGGKDATIQGPNDKGEYTVKLYIPDGKNGTQRVSIQVKPSFLTKTIVKKNSKELNNSSTKSVLAQPNTEEEIWPLLLEKALAELEGSYSEITGKKKQISLRGSEILTGKKANYYPLNEGIEAPINALIELYQNTRKIPMTQFGTKSKLTPIEEETEAETELPKPASGEAYILYKDRIRLYADHLYYLKGISNATKGAEVFILQNPHNDTDGWLEKHGGTEITIDRNDLEKYFSNIILTP